MSLTQINKAGLDEIALDHVFTIGASGSSAYTFQGEGLNGTVNNPTLYLTRGKTYRFENGSGGHPIRIQSTSGASGTAYNTGVTNNAGSGTVIVEVQHDAPDVLYYQCTSHAAMNGILYITGALADGGVTTAKIADNAVTEAKIVDGAIRNAKVDSAANIDGSKLADDSISLAKLEHGTSSNDGKFLRANNGADPTFETVTSTTINNNADNRVITGSGTANTLNGEANCTFNGDSLGLNSSSISEINLQTSNNTRFKIQSGSNFAQLLTQNDNPLAFKTDSGTGGGTERMRIQTNGQVGIGTNSPATQLEVKDSTDSRITITAGNAISQAGINFSDNSGVDGIVTFDHNTRKLHLGAGTSSFTDGDLTIDSSGKVGIGTTSPTEILHIKEGTNKNVHFTAGIGQIGNVTGLFAVNDANNAIVDIGICGTSVRIGTTAGERARFTGDGLCFNGDTAANNALDDFEKGSWTPRIGPYANNSVYESGVGTYFKVGDKVTCYYAFIAKNPNSFGSTVVRIWNLPYTIRHAANHNSAHDYGTCEMLHNISFNHNGKVYFYTNNNSTQIVGLESRTGTSWADWNTSSFSNNFYLHGHITYSVDHY